MKKLLWIIVVVLVLVLFLNPKKEETILADGQYENCYLMSLKDGKMKVIADGEELELVCPVSDSTEKRDKIIDIQIEKNKVKKIVWKEGMVTDKVDAVNLTEGWICLSTYGTKEIDAKGEFYIKSGDEVRLLSKAGSLLNRDKVSFYIFDDKICAAVLAGNEDIRTIKVLLHGEIEGIYHESVRLTAEAPYSVTVDGQRTEYDAGEETSFSKDMGEAKITCEDGRIHILSMERASGYPKYRGDIVVRSYEEGFVLRNDVNLEEYLYSVVSSEMPSTYSEEALKAQAVCARTYAIYQMGQAYYGEYGAHVDDTVNSQVYNNVAETESTKMAVDLTTGQYLSYEEEPICAYFYSTSCGMTSNVKDIWLSQGDSPVYLSGGFQGEPSDDGSYDFADLSDDEKFYKFITIVPENAYEKEEPWFRWKGKISYDKLSEHVESHIDDWIKENPSYYHLESDQDTVGKILKVQVVSRSKGGVIKKISLTGEYGVFTVTGEYQIRKVLCPDETELERKDGSKKTCNMLPSGYFAIENKEDILIHGGGYGHGAGMSQNGANKMAEKDYHYEDILGFYYPETRLVEAY